MLSAPILILWLVLPPIPAGDESAGEVFKKFEDSFGKASTLEIRFSGEQSVTRPGQPPPPQKYAFTGSVLVKGDSKLNYRFKVGAAEVVMLSDGTRMRAGAGRQMKEKDTPKNLRASFITPRLARLGALGTIAVPARAQEGAVEDSARRFLVSDFKLSDGEKGAKILSYAVKSDPAEFNYAVTITYEPGTMKILERTLIGKDAKAEVTIREVYEKYALHAEIPDDRFILPPQDK